MVNGPRMERELALNALLMAATTEADGHRAFGLGKPVQQQRLAGLPESAQPRT